MSIEFHVLSIFPEMFEPTLNESILKRAREKGLLKISIHNFREYTQNRHKTTDDYPYGGGSGMVMTPGPMAAAIESVKEKAPGSKVILMTPQGSLFNQQKARELSSLERIALVCGRYEGVDERIRLHFVDEEICVGDYILTGGELAAMIVIDSVTRLIPGVLGNEESCIEESFSGPALEYPQYTRPENFRGFTVPKVLLSGNHEEIRMWRRRESLKRTMLRRPDLLGNDLLNEEALKILESLKKDELK